MEMNKELSANTTLSHYRIVKKIGAGGMGEVYLALDTELNRTIALKILPAELLQTKSEYGVLFKKRKLLPALNHPNIAHIHEIGKAEGVRWNLSKANL